MFDSTKRRTEPVLFATSLALVGWSVIVLRALNCPTSWLSRQLSDGIYLQEEEL